jgi:hypothetical protein
MVQFTQTSPTLDTTDMLSSMHLLTIKQRHLDEQFLGFGIRAKENYVYGSLGSVSTLTKRIIQFFQKINF